MPLIDALRGVEAPRQGPLWKGPEDAGPLGGVTFSMLNSFLACRARFGIKYLEGVRPHKRFNARISYGNLWHICEEAHAERPHSDEEWMSRLQYASNVLVYEHPMSGEEIRKWQRVCKLQFAEYLKFWEHRQGENNEVPFIQEGVFDVPYSLPSGRTVRLRGKFDSVGSDNRGLVLQENKTKSELDVPALMRQLKFDLQTMLYAVALRELYQKPVEVRYNVVRRPLSGGKGTIVPRKATKGTKKVPGKPAETMDEYYERLRQYIAEEPETYFARFEVPLSDRDIDFFRDECLDPLLESVCNWYTIATRGEIHVNHVGYGSEWIHPYGCYNPVDETGGSDVDGYLFDGSMVGLERVDTLFEELQ